MEWHQSLVKIGVYVDAANIYRNGGSRMQYRSYTQTQTITLPQYCLFVQKDPSMEWHQSLVKIFHGMAPIAGKNRSLC
jgi:hypothetical protein